MDSDKPLGHLGLGQLGLPRYPSEDAVFKRTVYPGIGVAYYWEEPIDD